MSDIVTLEGPLLLEEEDTPWTCPVTLHDLHVIVATMQAVGVTPHRVPDFDQIVADCRADNEVDINVTGSCIFTETWNTGYAGHLERWLMHTIGKPEVTFMIDLPPGLAGRPGMSMTAEVAKTLGVVADR